MKLTSTLFCVVRPFTNSSQLHNTMADQLQIHLSFHGKQHSLQVARSISGAELIEATKATLPHFDNENNANVQLKLLWKGKNLQQDDTSIFSGTTTTKPLKIMVLETRTADVEELNSRTADPTIRGFDNERRPQRVGETLHWGPDGKQNEDFKFCRIQACSWQSFGHRPNSDTPHDFEARRLLEKMATDPGVVAVLKERELVVGTLGEMDPVDDRLMQKKQQEGGCLLGYNTNGGARIDVKLRNDNLKGFRSYPELVATLLHELSHNWVGEHNLLFWTNFGQMRVEYLFTHMIRTQGLIINGKTTAQIAALPRLRSINEIYDFVMNELSGEMRQHGLRPETIGDAIRSRCDELVADTDVKMNTLGSGSPSDLPASSNAREMARQAAERRAKQNRRDKSSQ